MFLLHPLSPCLFLSFFSSLTLSEPLSQCRLSVLPTQMFPECFKLSGWWKCSVKSGWSLASLHLLCVNRLSRNWKGECVCVCVCVPVCWSGGESCREILMRGDTLCLHLKHAHTHIHIHTSSTHAPLYLHLNQMHCPPHPLSLSLSLSPAVALSLHHPSPSFSSSPHTHVLPLLPQMGWVESWLRTFMPKTTCHPSLPLSRMVMLWEVRTRHYGRQNEIRSHPTQISWMTFSFSQK